MESINDRIKERVNINLTASLVRRLDALAAERTASRSLLVREAVERMLVQESDDRGTKGQL